ncbi:N-acetylmuramoyl-L-alanine amidase [Alteribacillus sp. HJP-4]|uniref:N-acetylmuramoyl-L-alanine amidase n=1 Tax=Alteribacillus sp. HJP-4 TaxID=2775394 RepID=UPI0035CD187F
MEKKIVYGALSLAVGLSIFSASGIEKAEASDRYVDVPNNHWATDEIDYMHDQGIAFGYEDTGEFRPRHNLMRSQAAIMLSRAYGDDNYNPSTVTFKDVLASHPSYELIQQAADLGIFDSDREYFNPNNFTTRAQMAKIIAVAVYGESSETYDGENPFRDISGDHWAKGYITKLADEGIVSTNGDFRPNMDVTRDQMASFIARALNEEFRLDVSGNDENETDSEILFEGVVVSSTPLNVRSGPSSDDSRIATIQPGEKINVYSKSGNWLEVRVNGKTGYVSQTYVDNVEDVQSDETPPPQPVTTAEVVTPVVARSGPDVPYPEVGNLRAGETIDIYEITNDDWVLIRFNGDWAYTHLKYLRLAGEADTPVSGETIVIDAGHGGSDGGAQANGLVEKQVNLAVALKVEDLLEDAGANVVMTRTNDTFISLNGRVSIAESANADSFVSIHANAATPGAEGAETFYNSSHQSQKSYELARSIQNRLVSETGMKFRRVAEAGFYVIKNTTMPSTLIELGFLTNTGDSNRMKQSGYNDKAARAVYNGIADYYE